MSDHDEGWEDVPTLADDLRELKRLAEHSTLASSEEAATRSESDDERRERWTAWNASEIGGMKAAEIMTAIEDECAAWIERDENGTGARAISYKLVHERIPWLLNALRAAERSTPESEPQPHRTYTEQRDAYVRCGQQYDKTHAHLPDCPKLNHEPVATQAVSGDARIAAMTRDEYAQTGYAAHAHSFGALVSIALLLNQDGVDDYADVVRGVEALAEECSRLRASLEAREAAINRACAIIELGDDRLMAGDGPAGGQPPDLSLTEWRTLYVTLDTARAALPSRAAAPTETRESING